MGTLSCSVTMVGSGSVAAANGVVADTAANAAVASARICSGKLFGLVLKSGSSWRTSKGGGVFIMTEPFYGDFDGIACRYTGRESWVLHDDWVQLNSSSVNNAVRKLTKAQFDQYFPNV